MRRQAKVTAAFRFSGSFLTRLFSEFLQKDVTSASNCQNPHDRFEKLQPDVGCLEVSRLSDKCRTVLKESWRLYMFATPSKKKKTWPSCRFGSAHVPLSSTGTAHGHWTINKYAVNTSSFAASPHRRTSTRCFDAENRLSRRYYPQCSAAAAPRPRLLLSPQWTPPRRHALHLNLFLTVFWPFFICLFSCAWVAVFFLFLFG